MLLTIALSTIFLVGVLAVAFFSVAAYINSHTWAPINFEQSKMLSREHKKGPSFKKPQLLSIITFNVHDMYLVSSHRTERIEAVAQILKRFDPDIVGLQEIWIEKDRQALLSSLKDSRLHYSCYFRSGLVGSGLFVLSAYPIVEQWFYRFTSKGIWWKLWHGDFWGGKGIALTRIQIIDGIFVDFYNAHSHSFYDESGEYDEVRSSNLTEIVQFVKNTSLPNTPAIVVGDFNCNMQQPQWNSLVSEDYLQRAMIIESEIDHIMVARNGNYTHDITHSFEILESAQLEDGSLVCVSDHPGYLSKIRIIPKEPIVPLIPLIATPLEVAFAQTLQVNA